MFIIVFIIAALHRQEKKIASLVVFTPAHCTLLRSLQLSLSYCSLQNANQMFILPCSHSTPGQKYWKYGKKVSKSEHIVWGPSLWIWYYPNGVHVFLLQLRWMRCTDLFPLRPVWKRSKCVGGFFERLLCVAYLLSSMITKLDTVHWGKSLKTSDNATPSCDIQDLLRVNLYNCWVKSFQIILWLLFVLISCIFQH